MKQPQAKKLVSGFQAVVLMSAFVQLAPSFGENASNVSISLLPGSFRLSYQIACRLPASSTASHGSYWSFGAGAPVAVMLMNLAWLQCLPKSRDCWNEMSAPETARFTLFWETNSSVPVVGLKASDGERGARKCLFGSRSLR